MYVPLTPWAEKRIAKLLILQMPKTLLSHSSSYVLDINSATTSELTCLPAEVLFKDAVLTFMQASTNGTSTTNSPLCQTTIQCPSCYFTTSTVLSYTIKLYKVSMQILIHCQLRLHLSTSWDNHCLQNSLPSLKFHRLLHGWRPGTSTCYIDYVVVPKGP